MQVDDGADKYILTPKKKRKRKHILDSNGEESKWPRSHLAMWDATEVDRTTLEQQRIEMEKARTEHRLRTEEKRST